MDSKPLLGTLYVPFFLPVKKVIERVERAFRESPVVQIKGHPIRIFCLSDPERVGQLYADRQAGGTKCPWLLPRVKYVMGNGGFISDGGDAYRLKRQKVQPAFRRSEAGGFLYDVVPLVEKALDAWAAPANDGVVFDFYHSIRQLMTRINMRMLLSVDLSDDELTRMEQEIHFLEADFVRPSPLSIPFPRNRRFRRLAARLRARIRRIVEERRVDPDPPQDLLSHLIGLKDENGEPWPDREVVDEILSIYFGASVLGTTLAWSFFELGKRPDIQEKLLEEAKSASGQLSDPESLTTLTYGQNVIKEVIRFYPAVWGYPRWTDHPLDLDGVPIPAKSLVIPMVYLIHRDPRFWKEPESFRPERFEGAEAPSGSSFTYLPFSAGPRTCLGMRVAPLILQLVITMVLSRYRVVFCPRFAGDPEMDLGFGIQPRDEVRVRLEPR